MASENSNKSKAGLILPLVTGGIAVGLSIVCYPFVSPALRRICLPYVPATTVQVENVMKALEGRKGTLLDIGSGDGRIVFAAANAGFTSHGVELNLWLVLYSKIKALFAKSPAPATFSRTDLWKFSVNRFDNIVVFGVEEMMEELGAKLESEMHPNARLVVCRFPLPECEPLATLGSGVDTVWVYRR